METDRLLLRDWREEDLEPFAALNADPEVMAHFPGVLSRERSDAMVADHPDLRAVEVRATGEFIGFVGLAVPRFEASFTPCTEIGWRLARAAWGHGYATEAARAVLDHAWSTLELEEVVSFTAVGNVRSRAVMERIGMSFVEEFEHPKIAPGHPLRRHALYVVRGG